MMQWLFPAENKYKPILSLETANLDKYFLMSCSNKKYTLAKWFASIFCQYNIKITKGQIMKGQSAKYWINYLGDPDKN